jgi:hypothetical protein
MADVRGFNREVQGLETPLLPCNTRGGQRSRKDRPGATRMRSPFRSSTDVGYIDQRIVAVAVAAAAAAGANGSASLRKLEVRVFF